MTHEHKLGIGITCTFLCLTGAVIGLKMRHQPIPTTANETIPEAEVKSEKGPGSQAKAPPVVPSIDGINKTPQTPSPAPPNPKKEPEVYPGLPPFAPPTVAGQINKKEGENGSLSKNNPPSTGAGVHFPSSKQSTDGTKSSEQTVKDLKNERKSKGEPGRLLGDKPTTNTLNGNQSSGGSFQMVGATDPVTDNSATSSMLKPASNPEDYFTKAIPVPTLPDMVAVPQGAMASAAPNPPSTPVAGPALFTSPPPSPPPPPPMLSIGLGTSSPSIAPRPGESSSPPPPKQEVPPRTNTPVESKQATPAWQPPLASKAEGNMPAPFIPTAAPPTPTPSSSGTKPFTPIATPPAPTPSPSGNKPPDGSYFIQEPHSPTNASGGSTATSGNKSTGNVPAPLPLPPPLPGGTERGRANASGSAATPTPVRPAPQVLVYDEIDYVCKPGDTFATISARWYQTEAFAEALKRHNMHHARASEQMAKYGNITPGEKIVIPPADILEQRYGDALVKPTVPPTNPTIPASYTPAPSPPGGSLSPPRP